MQRLVESTSNIYDFAQFTVANIAYMDNFTIEEEIKKIKRSNYATKYWILREDERIGVVKMSMFHFYDLALIPEIGSDEILDIFQSIEDKMRNSFTGKIHAHIQVKYLTIAKSLHWVEEYARYQMGVSLEKAQIVSYDGIKIKPYDNLFYDKLPDLFLDSYRGTRDEQIGMMTKETVHDSLTDIMTGRYGEFLPELSVISLDFWGKINGACMITESEGCAFLVIIGVKGKFQKKGIGRKLLSYSIEKCRVAGYSCMRLWVTKDIPAVKFYQSMGFEVLNEVVSIQKSKN